MANKKYWQNFSDFNKSEVPPAADENEFPEELAVQDAAGGLANSSATRRDFLKYLGFSTAAAALAASCEAPIRKAIPFVNRPADLVPGVADFYATTYVHGGESYPVLAKVRDGRPIKLEGNNLSSFTGGSTSARVQAAVLDLYDTSRLRFPIANGTATSIEEIDKTITTALTSAGGPVVLLTSTVTSPTTRQLISEFIAKFPGSRHVQFDGISYSGMLLANEASYGKRALPTYRFDQAKVVVGLGADFLGTWLNPLEYQRSFAVGRKVRRDKQEMTKHYQFESMMSVTGANADERFTHRPSETGAVALALLNAINGQPVAGVTGKVKAGVEKVAAELKSAGGAGIVVSGSNSVHVQTIVNAINEAIGANGKTIDWSVPLMTKQGVEADLNTLISDMDGGRVGAVIVYDANPAYNYYDAARFINALKKVRLSISLSEKKDETTELCKYIVPSHHFLESWGDAEPKTGYISMMQPTIAPLFRTRQFQDSLLKWTGNPVTYEVYTKTYWTGKLGGENNYMKALQDGVIEPSTPPVAAGGGFNGGGVAVATAALSGPQRAGKTELVLYQHIGIGDGKQANNPWLQELPDPITRATWDNYVMISPKLGKELLHVDIGNQRDADKYEVHPGKPLLNIKVGNKEIELPSLIVPGMHDDTIAIAVGYGRSSLSGKEEDTARNIGRGAVNVGKNVFGLAKFDGTTADWIIPEVTVSKGTGNFKVAQTQTHSSYEGRHEVVKEITLNEYKQNPNVIRDMRAKELQPWGGLEKFESEGTLYPVYDRPGIRWGMSIDLNSCFGCGACVVACNAENNIPVVGKSEVARYHDMHWMRIDRYFTGDPDNAESIQTVFQPMLCQHCDNAPCENVCPVSATNHNNEGINQMIYNRCIGTRYCANNCPYKVRRFNWADYTGADSFKHNQEGIVDDSVMMMNDDLTRMVLNPDVTVRSRGVIEKCSFCVQRLQEGKLKAKKENRPLVDSDAVTACAQACPTNAIVFGNANDPESLISKTRSENSERVYHVLEQIHTLPNVNYLAKVRNTNVLSAHAEDTESSGTQAH